VIGDSRANMNQIGVIIMGMRGAPACHAWVNSRRCAFRKLTAKVWRAICAVTQLPVARNVYQQPAKHDDPADRNSARPRLDIDVLFAGRGFD
jgi:hypothetical protein